jgi:hypothetical protein
MKRSILTVLFSLAASGFASAAVTALPLRMPAPVTPLAILPATMPTPLSGPLSGLGISLPVRRGPEHLIHIPNRRDEVNNPIKRVMPEIAIRFVDGAEQPAGKKEDLDELFDKGSEAGRSERGPVGSSRRVSFPELDLERELGI